MEWQDQGLVLSARRHGERDAILEVMTAEHGRHLGLVRGGRSTRQSPVLQPGNRVQLTWRARLEDHLGQYVAEPLQSRAGVVLSDTVALYAVTHLGILLRLLPERAPHRNVYEAADGICSFLGNPLILAPFLIRFELMILSELGFGLDLSQCAVTGETEDLVYVSPKSGRAVSRAAGAPWAGKLLPLPACLRSDGGNDGVGVAEIIAGFQLSGFFLERHLFDPRGIPINAARAQMLSGIVARLNQP